MAAKTFGEKIDDATHAAMEAAGLSVRNYDAVADEVSDFLATVFMDHVTSDTDEDDEDDDA